MNWKYTIFNLSFIGKFNSINKLCTIFLKGCCLFRGQSKYASSIENSSLYNTRVDKL